MVSWRMMLKARLVLVVFIGFYLSACSSIPNSKPETRVSSSAVTAAGDRIDMTNHAQVRSQLLEQLAEWKGVPYRYGGLSKKGVDCSGFIYLTFAEEFGIRIPRTTKSQVLKGIVIDQSDLLPGDLVFFNTGYKQRHIGIYVGKKQFIHASSSRGVMLSRLDNPYWQSAYWHSRRVDMSLSRAQTNLMQGWNNRHSVTPWECERDRRIEKVQGWSNHFVSDRCQ